MAQSCNGRGRTCFCPPHKNNRLHIIRAAKDKTMPLPLIRYRGGNISLSITPNVTYQVTGWRPNKPIARGRAKRHPGFSCDKHHLRPEGAKALYTRNVSG